jgi:hypothetical protein
LHWSGCLLALGWVRLRSHADANLALRAARRVPERAAHLLHPPRGRAIRAGDALLCAPAITSVAQLSPEPSHRRGWGSAYDALASGRLTVDRPRDLPMRFVPATDPPVFAVDVTTWPRCDAECSPARGYYYHPSRHSAGQPIIAGWAWQWIAQLSFARDSWTAPVDAARLHPLEDTDQQAAGQIRALLERLPAGGLLLRRPTTTATRQHGPAAPPRSQVQPGRPDHLARPDR